MSEKSINHIVYITDENYVLPTLVSLNSLVANTPPHVHIQVHVIAVEVSERSRKKFSEIHSGSVSVQVHDFKDEYADFDVTHLYVSKAALFKFRLPEIFLDLDRILYIDGDIILNKGFEKIFEHDISSYYAAVTQDMIAVLREKWTEKLGCEKYFNSGMMYLNLAKMRQDGCVQRLIEHKKNEVDHHFMDQNVLNIVLGHNVTYLDCRFNFMVTYLSIFTMEQIASFFCLDGEEAQQCKKSPYFLHFTSPNKVWNDFRVLLWENWAEHCNESVVFPLMKNYCMTLAGELERQNAELERQNARLDKLFGRIEYVSHRTLYGACAWLWHKILGR